MVGVNNFATRAERFHLFNQPRVHGIAVQRTAGERQHIRKGRLSRLNSKIRQRRNCGFSGERGRVFTAAEIRGNHGAAIEFSVFVQIGEIVFLKNVIRGLEFANRVSTRIRPGNEVIPDRIEEMVRFRMSAHETADAPIVNHVVDILDAALGLGITALIIDPEVVRVSDVRHGIGKRSKPLRINAFTNNAILERNVVAASGEAQAIPTTPLDAAMIENHFRAAGKINRAFTFIATDSFPKSQVANNDVALTAERNRTAMEGDALARGGAAVERHVAADREI